MSQRNLIWLGLLLGSSIGGWLPSLFHQGIFSPWSFFWGTVGSVVGVWAGYRISRDYL